MTETYPNIVLPNCHALRHLPLVGVTREEFDREIGEIVKEDRARIEPKGLTVGTVEMKVYSRLINAGFHSVSPESLDFAIRERF